MKRIVLSVTLACALILSGCGSNDEDQAKTEISKYLMEQQASAQMVTLKKGEADCIAGDMVDGIGVDQLKKYGFLNEDGTMDKNAKVPEMNQGDATTMVDAMFGCTDVMATMDKQLTTAMGAQPPKVRACVTDALDEKAVRSILQASFEGDREGATKQISASLQQCMMQGMDLPKK